MRATPKPMLGLLKETRKGVIESPGLRAREDL